MLLAIVELRIKLLIYSNEEVLLPTVCKPKRPSFTNQTMNAFNNLTLFATSYFCKVKFSAHLAVNQQQNQTNLILWVMDEGNKGMQPLP